MRPAMRRKLSTATTVGMRLRRGYAPPGASASEVDLRREEADDFAARVPVDKLVFVVHGIGQVESAQNVYKLQSEIVLWHAYLWPCKLQRMAFVAGHLSVKQTLQL